ncbi:Protein of unknown function [Pyronema omphalodes CBS 100304]|uniref:Uncharacterized protein n=1 Tax=Pyronema omphalodes (strain CBS 100304) TaxID=1076935 RepID=U4LL11_PYROM|nr:Protein of unknown function [Pyronema omphalodes CBS 100304]
MAHRAGLCSLCSTPHECLCCRWFVSSYLKKSNLDCSKDRDKATRDRLLQQDIQHSMCSLVDCGLVIYCRDA